MDVPEQGTAVVEEQAALAQEPAGAASGEQAPVAEPTTAQPVAESPQIDLSTIDGIRKAAEQNPQLKAWREDGFNAGRLKREKELREEQGTSEFAQSVVDFWQQKYGVELDESDRRNLPLWTKAAQDRARLDAMRALATEAKGLASSEEEALYLQSLIDQAEGKPDEMEQVAARSISAVASKASRSALDNLADEEIESHPRIKAKLDALLEQRLADEERARAVEAQHKDAPPEAPPGTLGAPGMTKERLNAMPRDQKMDYLMGLSDEERSALWDVVAG